MSSREFSLYAFIPNALSLGRIAFAAAFAFPKFESIRPILILFMGITDFLDGFLARKWGVESRLGTILDPIADKISALLIVWIFWLEGRLSGFQIGALFMRDLSLLLFYLYLQIRGEWDRWKIQSFYFGKIATALQFIIFFILSLSLPVSSILYAFVALCGAFSLIELLALSSKNHE